MDGSLDGSEEPLRQRLSNMWAVIGRREHRETGMVVPISLVIFQMVLIPPHLKTFQNHS